MPGIRHFSNTSTGEVKDMINRIIGAIKKICYTRPQCPVDKKWCAQYDGMCCTMSRDCPVLKDHQ
jgi:hypothetical protein